MFEALRCIFVPYRPRAIEDRLLGLEPALDDFGSKHRLLAMDVNAFCGRVRPSTSILSPQERRKSRERELPRSQPGSANWPVLPIGMLQDIC
jgi:hypothetical protein